MTRDEFAPIMAYLAAGIGKAIPEQTATVYFDLLGDLPAAVLLDACRVELLRAVYPVIPLPGKLREAVLSILEPCQNGMMAVEAWAILRRAMARYGYFREDEGLTSLPPLIRRTAECLGWQAICECTETEILRAQFTKAYEALAGRAQREALLPPALRQATQNALDYRED